MGLHKRMGDVWIPDRAITIEEVLAGFSILENDWMAASSIGDKYGMRKASLTAAAVIGGFFAGLRGEEIAKMDLGALRSNWDEATRMPLHKRHVPLMLAGRFKREIGEKLFCQPLAPITKTGVQILLWFQRLIRCLEAHGETDGAIFKVWNKNRTKHSKARVGDLDIMFLSLWKRIQILHPNLIPKTVDVDDEYSISRSARRGSTTHAFNMQIPPHVVEANNHWRKHQRSRGSTPNMSMMERYSDAKASVPTLIRYSSSM